MERSIKILQTGGKKARVAVEDVKIKSNRTDGKMTIFYIKCRHISAVCLKQLWLITRALSYAEFNSHIG